MLIDKPRCNFRNCRYCFDGNCYSADKYENCKLTDLHYGIAKLTVDLENAKGKWVSVDERLPEIEQIVLCCLGLVQNVYTYKGDNTWEDSYGYYQKDEPITHWMPLPEPPKMKGGAE